LTKTVGTLVHGAHGSVDWRVTRRLAAGSVPATLLTLAVLSRFHPLDAGNAQLISTVLGIALVLTAVALFLRRSLLAYAARRLDGLSERTTMGLTVLTGAVLGVLVTVSSVGAGAIGVTALILLYPKRSTLTIVGSDIAHAVPLTLVAGIGHVFVGSVDYHMLASLLCGSIPGIIAGSLLAVRVPEAVLRPILAVTLLVVGGRLVY
jgi:uncharacterized membrane protein YfcA